MHSLPLFHSLPRPFHSLPCILRSQGLQQLCGSLAVETHWFRWKEIDVWFTIAVTLLLLRLRTQRKADNYQGRQSLTSGGPKDRSANVSSSCCQADSTVLLTPAARWSLVRFPVTDSGESDPVIPGQCLHSFDFVFSGLYTAFSLQVYTSKCTMSAQVQSRQWGGGTAWERTRTNKWRWRSWTDWLSKWGRRGCATTTADEESAASEQREWTEMNHCRFVGTAAIVQMKKFWFSFTGIWTNWTEVLGYSIS